MIRDWRKINQHNVNNAVLGYWAPVGQLWISCICTDADEEGMRHVMSLNPNRSSSVFVPPTPFPPSLIQKPTCLRVYIECGGLFKDIFLHLNHDDCNIYFKTKASYESVLYLFEQGACPPLKWSTLPRWVRQVYRDVENKRQKCRLACALLSVMHTLPPLVGIAHRDILSMIIRLVWTTRTDKW